MWSKRQGKNKDSRIKAIEYVDLCSCYVIQHFCDIVFVLSSFDYEGLSFLSHNKESPIVIEIKLI